MEGEGSGSLSEVRLYVFDKDREAASFVAVYWGSWMKPPVARTSFSDARLWCLLGV